MILQTIKEKITYLKDEGFEIHTDFNTTISSKNENTCTSNSEGYMYCVELISEDRAEAGSRDFGVALLSHINSSDKWTLGVTVSEGQGKTTELKTRDGFTVIEVDTESISESEELNSLNHFLDICVSWVEVDAIF